MNKAFVAYYDHLAKLARVANKQTLFLAHILYQADHDKKTGMLIVNLNAALKRKIIGEIESETGDRLRLAGQYLTKLKRAGLIKSLGGGMYSVDPESFGDGRYVSPRQRGLAAKIFESRTFNFDGSVSVDTFLIDENGEQIEL